MQLHLGWGHDRSANRQSLQKSRPPVPSWRWQIDLAALGRDERRRWGAGGRGASVFVVTLVHTFGLMLVLIIGLMLGHIFCLMLAFILRLTQGLVLGLDWIGRSCSPSRIFGGMGRDVWQGHCPWHPWAPAAAIGAGHDQPQGSTHLPSRSSGGRTSVCSWSEIGSGVHCGSSSKCRRPTRQTWLAGISHGHLGPGQPGVLRRGGEDNTTTIPTLANPPSPLPS